LSTFVNFLTWIYIFYRQEDPSSGIDCPVSRCSYKEIVCRVSWQILLLSA